ncbi:MAG: methylated-DNA--[protein]-cysteine S-methyltransferase [Gaiellaceae bacterium]
MGLRHVRYAVERWGVGELWLDGVRLVQHELPRPDLAPNGPQGIPEIPDITLAGEESRDRADSVTNLTRRLQAFFRGERVDFDDVELDLDWCTPFQRAAVDALRAVPYGEVVTYGELAALAGHPGAQRAAGSFCAANRFGLVVPCHRVVAASGLGAYGSLGTAYKRRLLELESCVSL